jgi:hypothetical protein
MGAGEAARKEALVVARQIQAGMQYLTDLKPHERDAFVAGYQKPQMLGSARKRGGPSRLAPNGKPSNLNESQWNQVRTPQFKAWFGDWENDAANASKVVDENGEPMVVYHGTPREFDHFSMSYFGRNDDGFYGRGFYFTPNKESAVRFLEYLVSDQAQVYFADGNNEWPVVKDVKTQNPALKALGNFKADSINVGLLAKNQALVQKIYDRAGWK